MLSQLTKYEDRALRSARLLGRRLQAYAIVQFGKGNVPRPSAQFLVKQLPLLTDLMVVANLRGRLDARKAAFQAEPGYALALATPSDGPIFNKTIEIMRKALGPSANLKALEQQYNIVALRTLSNVSDTIEKDIRATAYGLIERGATVKEAKDVLGKRFDALGLTPRNSFQLETIFRTASSVAYGAGSWAAYQDPDIQEILWGYTYSAVMDDRTRENHAAAEGTTLPKDDEFWQRMWPPNGYNCRCEVIPLFSRERINRPPPEAVADPGFGYNPGAILSGLADTTGLTDAPAPKPLPLPAPEPPAPAPAPVAAPEPIDIVSPAPEPPAAPEAPGPNARITLTADELKASKFGEGDFTVPTEGQQLTWLVGEKWNPVTRQYENANPVDIAAQVAPYVQKLSAQTGLDIQPEVVINTPPATLQEWSKAASAMVAKFPKILENVQLFNVNRSDPDFRGRLEREIPRGRAYRYQKRVEMLSKRAEDLRNEMIEDLKTQWSAKIDDPEKNGAQATMIHELGHQVGYELEREDGQDYNTWAMDWARAEQATEYVSANFSRYAGGRLALKGLQSFRAELTAESFVEIMLLDSSKWSRITRELVKMLERRGYAI